MSTAAFCPLTVSGGASPSCHGQEESIPVSQSLPSLPENKNPQCLSGPAMQKALTSWPTLPAWVRALAEACDGQSLRKTASRCKVSPAMVSLAINNKREQWDFIKSKVENSLMVSMMACPVLGVISNKQCEQEQLTPFSAANPLRVQLYRACHNGCKHFKGVQK